MEKKECVKKDREVLDAFYKEYFSKSHIQIGYVVAGILFIFFQVILCCCPYQEIKQDLNEGLFIALLMSAGSTAGYMNAYQHAYDRKGAVVSIMPYLRYQPISFKAWKKYLLWKFLKLQWKVYAMAQAGQILFTLLAVRELAWCNLLYPLLAAMVIPAVMFTVSMLIMEAK